MSPFLIVSHTHGCYPDRVRRRADTPRVAGWLFCPISWSAIGPLRATNRRPGQILRIRVLVMWKGYQHPSCHGNGGPTEVAWSISLLGYLAAVGRQR